VSILFRTISRMREQRLLAVAALLGVALTGCSVDEPSPTEQSSTARSADVPQPAPEPREQQFLTRADVEEYPRGSPERAVFEFWFRVQYRDLLSAYESLTPEFRREFAGSLRRFGTYVMADYPRWLTNPRLLFVRTEGNEAMVALAYRNTAGAGERSSFSLRRTPAGWAVAYDFYLANRLTAK
jgi:hypothetical protein